MRDGSRSSLRTPIGTRGTAASPSGSAVKHRTAISTITASAAAAAATFAAVVSLFMSLAASSAGHASAAFEAGATAIVRADGDCLRLRATPGLDGTVITCLIEGSSVILLGDEAESDGYHWQLVAAGDDAGWLAGAYLELSTAATTGPPAPAPVTTGTAAVLPLPPPGGLALGLAGTSDPAALAAAQPFDVKSISVLDVGTQRFLVYIPGAPPLVNSLTAANLRPDRVATVRRAGSTPSLPPPPSTDAATPALGTPNALPAPPEGGMTQGVSGTTDPQALAAAQSFEVLGISMLHVATQSWLVHIPGAPAAASTLHGGNLTAGSIVTIRAGSVPDAPAPPPAPAPTLTATPTPTPTPSPTPTPTPTPTSTPTPVASNQVLATISYYYCTQGSIPASIGDGGGFCGAMANGEIVYAGAASCASAHMRQRFRIEGDPLDLVYTCADTGGAVTGEHRDIWFENSDEGYLWWQTVGPSAFIEILSE